MHFLIDILFKKLAMTVLVSVKTGISFKIPFHVNVINFLFSNPVTLNHLPTAYRSPGKPRFNFYALYIRLISIVLQLVCLHLGPTDYF